MRSSLATILLYCTLLLVFPNVIAQRNSYLALWQSAFDDLTSSDIDRAADKIESSIPARGKIREIIKGKSEQDSITDAEGSDEDSTSNQRFGFGHLKDVVQQKREEFRQARSFRNLTSLVEETLRLLKATDGEQKQLSLSSLGALGNMTETLMEHAKHIQDLKDNDRADASKIASLAILQGWILRKMISGQQREFHGLPEETAGAQAPSPSPFGGAFGHGQHVKVSQLGVVVPESMDNMFSPSLCFRMQNFGNSDGFLSCWTAYGPECSARTAADASAMKWRKESYYSIDCNLRDETIDSNWHEANATDVAMPPIAAYAGALGFENMAAKSMRALTKTSHCIFAISSTDPSSNSHGTGSIMKISSISSRFSALKANCIRVRLCNRNLDDYLAQSLAQEMSDPTITLQSFTLNGRPLTLESLTKVQAQTSDGSCSIMLLRVPSRALSDNFIMTGRLLTHDQQHIHDQRAVKQYGVGEESSVDIQVGTLTIL